MAVRVQRTIELAPDPCFEAFCQLERVPEWFSQVVHVQVETRTRDGRPEEVWFETRGPDGERLQYTLQYAYDPQRRRILWRPGRNADAGLHGVATFEAVPEGCVLTYTIQLGAGRDERRARAQAEAEAVTSAFAAWLSR